MENDLIDDYLLTPSLSYMFINQNCKFILQLNNISNDKLLNYSIGEFFYSVCNLENSKNIKNSIERLDNLADSDIKYFIPSISAEIKRSLDLLNEN